MRLWLIRHAHAGEGATDATRPLSPRGESQAEALGRFLRQANVARPAEIWHSPLLRARQTAERVAAGAEWTAPLREGRHLLPYDDVELLAGQLAEEKKDAAIVGHEPHMGRLASWLLTGDAEAEAFVMRKGTVLALESRPLLSENQAALDRWSVSWMVTPEMLGEM